MASSLAVRGLETINFLKMCSDNLYEKLNSFKVRDFTFLL